MKAIIIKEHGGLDKLAYADVEDPKPSGDEVVMRVHATCLNHVDIDVRNGVSGVESIQSLPHIMGVDPVGEVASIGPDVTLWKAGDRVAPHFILSCGKCPNCRSGKENICTESKVLGLTAWGSYAEMVKVRQHHLVQLPEGVEYDAAAAGLTPFATAWEALVITAQLRPGETVLVTGAGGGVGSHALQVARLAGATVIAAVGADAKGEQAKQNGAESIVNYNNEALHEGVKKLTGGRGVDVVLDGIGGTILKSCIQSLTDGGRIASIGAHGGEVVDIDMIQLFRKHISILGCGRSTREIYATVLGLMAQGKLKPIVHGSWPLADAAEAQALMESRNFFGRIVLNP